VENVRLLQAERERSEQLAFAISEVHHRVKNSLQAVGALLEIQIPDEGNVMPVEAVKDSLSQIKTIALVHDLLSKDSPIGLVDAAQVLTNLAKLLAHGMKIGDRPLPIRVKAEPIQLPTKAATSLALVVNELLTNAAKHNTRLSDTNSARPGAIEVTLSQKGKEAVVVVRDDGPGFPSDFDPDRDAHIGLQVVQTLVAFDLQGQVTFGNAISEQGGQIEGAKIEIVFPLAALIE
jgi:two-component sensor histidine kinase